MKTEQPKALKQPAQQQEPVAQVHKDPETGKLYVQWTMPLSLLADGTKFYTSQLHSKPLTDKEIENKWSEAMADTEHQTYLPIKEFARAIEAAHGIKE